MLPKTFFKATATAIALCLVYQLALAQDLERRELNPPQLSSYHLAEHIICYRPMRQGSPAMSIEDKDGKLIVNNYGHGGSGWTLGPGAAKYVVALLQKQADAQQLTKQTPIAVVGAGALGLFSALELINQGFTNVTIYATSFDNLTSHKAGGLLAPVSMNNNPQAQEIIEDIGIEAYIFYKDIAMSQNKQIPRGAAIIPAYFVNREDSGLEPYVGRVMQPAKDVLVDFKNGTTHKMVVYDDGIFIDTIRLMHSLNKVLRKSKVSFVRGQINSLSQLQQKVIFNCTGLGAKQLSNDDKMVPVQGHLIMLKAQNPKNLNYMILVHFSKGKTKNNQDLMRSFYFFPKRAIHTNPDDVGVIGGTYVENADSSTPNTEEFDIMLQAAKRFYGLKFDPR